MSAVFLKGYLFVITIYAAISIIYYLLFNLRRKKNEQYAFNKIVLDTNTQIIKRRIESITEYFHEDIYSDVYNIKETTDLDVSYSLKVTSLKSLNIYINPYFTKGSDTYDDFVHHTKLDDTKLSPIGNTSLELMYDDYKKIIDAYDKCNSITQLARAAIVFPWTSLFVYTVMLIIMGVAIGLVIQEFNMVTYATDFLLLTEIEKITKTKKEVSEVDKDTIECHYKTSIAKHKVMSKKKVAIYAIGIVFVIFIAVIAMISFDYDTSSYITNLYAGTGFVNNECTDNF